MNQDHIKLTETPGAKPKKIGKFRASLELTKSAWRVLKLDKELVALPVLSTVVSVIAIGFYIGLIFAGVALLGPTLDQNNEATLSNYIFIPVIFIFMLVITFIANFFGAALIYGATERFRGGNPTVKSSIAGARLKTDPLFWYSLMMTTVGLILQLIQERVPLGGKIVVWLVNGAWSVANAFALPVIVLSDGKVKPFDATRKSVNVVKKVWGEGVILSASIGIVSFLAVLTYILTVVAVGVATAQVSSFVTLNVFLAVVAFVGLMVLVLILTAIGSIIKAALYHYATTGEAVETFNKELLHTAFTRKKARAIFG